MQNFASCNQVAAPAQLRNHLSKIRFIFCKRRIFTTINVRENKVASLETLLDHSWRILHFIWDIVKDSDFRHYVIETTFFKTLIRTSFFLSSVFCSYLIAKGSISYKKKLLFSISALLWSTSSVLVLKRCKDISNFSSITISGVVYNINCISRVRSCINLILIIINMLFERFV